MLLHGVLASLVLAALTALPLPCCSAQFKGQGANQTLVDATLLASLLGSTLEGQGEGGEKGRGEGRGEARVASALARFEREMCDKAEPKVVASRDAALLYHSPVALESSVYGVSGVPAAAAEGFLAELSTRGITAADAGDLEARAVTVWRESLSVVRA